MKSKISEPLNWPIFHMLVLICATATMSYHQKMFQKISILKKAFLGSSCSALVIKKFKKIPVEEFHFSEIIVLYPATLPDNELFHSHFLKVFNHNCRIVQWPFLKVSKTACEEWQEYINSGIPKRGNKIKRGIIPL